MSDLMDQVFGQFDAADPTASGGSSPYISGHSLNQVEIKSVKFAESKKDSKIYFIVEYVVLSTNRDDINVGDIEYAWVHNLMLKHYGMENCKQFMAAAVGLAADSPEALALSSECAKEACSDDQPLTGIVVTLETKVKPKKDGSDFTIHEWSPAVGAETEPAA